MLKDESRPEDFRTSEHWKSPLMKFDIWIPQENVNGKKTYKSNSFSGNERNRLLFGGAEGFTQRTLVSGVDCREDARSFALFDYDRDGWLDIVLPSINGQRLRLFRNRLSELGATGRVVEVSLQGSHNQPIPEVNKSNRDAIGAVLTVVTDRNTRVFRKSVGEGLAAQNSGRIRVTLAEGEKIRNLAVRWPSGKTTLLEAFSGKSQILITE